MKPQVCALAKHESVCKEPLRIQWRAGKPMHLCLFVDSEAAPLVCWQERTSGVYHYQAHTPHSLMFQLRQESDNQLLTSEMFSVIREHTEYRQRRRKPWNFFERQTEFAMPHLLIAEDDSRLADLVTHYLETYYYS